MRRIHDRSDISSGIVDRHGSIGNSSIACVGDTSSWRGTKPRAPPRGVRLP